jgi:hypothetical protein
MTFFKAQGPRTDDFDCHRLLAVSAALINNNNRYSHCTDDTSLLLFRNDKYSFGKMSKTVATMISKPFLPVGDKRY